jgi:transposase-like protein
MMNRTNYHKPLSHKPRGKKGGRKSRFTPEQKQEICDMYASGEHNMRQIAEKFGVSISLIQQTITPRDRRENDQY